MGFWEIFKRQTASSASQKQKDLRQQSFFLNQTHHEHYLRHGWCRIAEVVNASEIRAFLDTYESISDLAGFELTDKFLNSGRLHNPKIRERVHEAINRGASTILPRIFDMQKVATRTGGAFQVKPPSDKSELQIHQDSSVIDEDNDYCLFVWIPLCDVTLVNGPLHFLSGSHLWGNTQRSLGVPWNFEQYDTLLRKHMLPVVAQAGDVIVFDPAILHSSSKNMSADLRCAITLTVLRQNYQLVYYYIGEDTPIGMIEKYYISEEFYSDYDFVSRPDGNRFPMSLESYSPFNFSAKQIQDLIRLHLHEH